MKNKKQPNIKHTINYIRTQFEKENYKLIEQEYVGAHTKMAYVCLNGHKHKINWANWSQGKRCPYCYGNVKLTLEFLKKEFDKDGYVLLSRHYIGNKQKLDYICPNGHKHGMEWVSWKNGHRCPTCAGNVPYKIEFIKEEFEKEGYKLLTDFYANSKQKLDYICPADHLSSISFTGWRLGQRCNTCAHIKMSAAGHWNWQGGISCEPYCQDWTRAYKEYIKERDGYKCLNPYCNSKNPNDLTVHHIDYNKKACGPENLITVCRSCNAKANYDRDWHTMWYQIIINKRYSENHV